MDNDTRNPIEIPLNREFVTIIDSIDRDLATIHWYAHRKHGRYYASRTGWENGCKISLSLHRIIMERVLGRHLSPDEFIDHADNNPLNNTRSNLRLATPSQNTSNSRKRLNAKSPYKGIDYMPRNKKWRARITLYGKSIHLGLFRTPEEAHQAYCKAAEETFGEFARYE